MRLLTIFILFVFLNAGFAQQNDIRFNHITVDDGLVRNWVTCITQDSYGFMWFGTGGSGINRYNGYDFAVYRNNEKDKNTLSSDYVNFIYEDKKKNLWAGTTSGLNLYNRDNDRFIPVKGIETENITGIYELNDSVLLVVNLTNIIELKQNKVNVIIKEAIFSNTVNCSILKDQKGKYWLASSDSGLYSVDILKRQYYRNKHNEYNSNSISSDRIRCSYIDNKKRIWIGTWDKGLSLIKYRNDGSYYFKNILPSNSGTNSLRFGAIRAILDDNNGGLWVGTENSGLDILDLNCFDKDEIKFSHYQYDKYENNSLSNNSIYCMYKDKQGTIWLGTYAAGINYYNKLLFQFEHYKSVPGNKNSLSSNVVNFFYEEGDELWIATEGGLNIFNRKTGEIKIYSYSANDERSISSNAVWSIFKDSRNNIWIGTWAGGLNLFDRKTGTFSHFYHDINNPESIGSNNIFGIIEDQHYLYLATMDGGLGRYDFNTGKFKNYKLELNKKNNIPSNWVQGIFKTSKGEIFLGTFTGLSLFNPVTETFTNYLREENNDKSIANSTVNDLYEDSKHNLWLATEGGLSLFERESQTFKSYTTKDGLPSNSLKSICEDSKGNLWIGTNNGLAELMNAVNLPSKPVFRAYNKLDGLQGNEFCRKSRLAGNDGKLYFGGYNGFNAFYPDSIRANPNIPAIVITDFLLFNKKVEIGADGSPLKKSITRSTELVLNYDQYIFTFKYAALNYLYPEKNQYKYIMEGFEKEWNNVGSKREATYTNLSPGTYTFKVIGSNNNNLWNEKGASIKIIILSPWWKTWWFRTCLFILFIMIVYSFYYIRLKLYRERQNELKLLVQQSTRDLEEKNKLLLQRQAQIEKQDEEIRIDSAILKEANELLYERQLQIQKQAEQLKETNNQLSLLNATKDRFFSIIAHDLRNPFNIVIGFSEILIRNVDKLPKEKVNKFLNMIHVSSKSGNNLLENLLQWSRLQTGRIAFEPLLLNLSVIAEETIRLLEGEADRKSIEIQQIVDHTISVMADENMLKTILRNLVSNAIKFTGEKGKIIIKAELSKSFAEITVSDTGMGIPEENIDKLFRVDVLITTKGTAKESGTGLGLILCKDFVERHNGKIWVESKLGKGSDFKFTIPLA